MKQLFSLLIATVFAIGAFREMTRYSEHSTLRKLALPLALFICYVYLGWQVTEGSILGTILFVLVGIVCFFPLAGHLQEEEDHYKRTQTPAD